ncbi:MAG TPA: Ig-like domain-containing protein, partial [Kofleriaceae bacterium]
MTDASGIASVTATANATAGAYTVTGSITGITPVASFSLANIGPPASIDVSSGDGQSKTVNHAFADLVAIVRDAANQPVPGATVTFTAPSGSGVASATLGGPSAATDASGLATMTAIANTVAGNYAVTASVGGGVTPASFSLTNTADVAVALQRSSGNSQSATVATAFGAPLVVEAVDAFNNPVAGITVTFTPPASEPTCLVGTTSADTDGSGLVQTSVTAGTKTGTYSVSATALGLLPTSFSLTNTPGAPASITLTGGNSQSAVVHTAFAQALTAVVRDSFSNLVPGANVTYAAPNSGASATVPAAVTNGSGVASTTATANATAGGYVVTASIAGGASTLYSLTNLPGAPATVSITAGGGQSATVGTAFGHTIDVLVVDSDSNPVPATTVTLTGPGLGAGIASTVNLTTNASGTASGTVTANHTAGSYTVSASVTGVATSPTVPLTNNPGTATALAVVSGNSQHAVVTTAFASSLVVVATDTFGNLVPGAQVTFSAPVSGPTALLSPTTATTLANGRASTSATAGTRTGSYSVTASITGASTTFTLTNDHGAAAAISVVSGDAQSTTVNTAFAASLVAHVSDAQGNDVPGATVTFTPPVAGARATLGSPTATTNASGNAQTTATANTISGSYSVSASITGASTSFALTNLAGTPVTVTITSGGPQTTMVGTVFPQPVAVRVLDLFDNPVPGANVTLSGPATGASLASSVGLTTGAAGTASGNVTANNVAGTFALSAAVGGVVAASTVQLTNTPAPAASVAIVAGNNQHATVTVAFVNRLVVVVSDAFGNPVPGITVTFSAPASGASATLSPTSGVTASNGRTNIAATANTRAGTYSVTASITGASTAFTLTNDAGAAAAIAVASGDNQSATVATAFAALVAHVTDSFGNDVPGATVTFAAPVSGARASLGTPTATTSASGLAQTAATAGQITGSYTVSATVASVAPISFHLTNTAGAVATLTVTGGGGQSAVVVTAFAAPLAIHAADQFNNPVPSATITFSAPASGPSATFPGAGTATTNASGDAQIVATAGTVAGSYSAHAASGSAPAATFALTNLPGAPAQVAATSGTPQSTVVATAFGLPLRVRVTDAQGNPAPGATVHFDPANTPATATPSAATAITDGAGLAEITAIASTTAGSHDLTASVAAASAVFHLSNTADAPASIAAAETASPQATTVLHGFAQPLGVIVHDRFGNPVPGATVTYSVPDSGASATLSSETAMTDASGAAGVNATANATAGAYIARASVDGVIDGAPFSLTNLADAAATLVVASGDPQSAVVNTDFAAPIVAQVRDSHGNGVPGVVVEFAAPTSDATATLTSSSAISDSAGHAAMTAHASTTTGSYLITASLADASSPVTFRLTNTPAAPATITASPSSTPQAAQVDHPFSQPLVAQVRDTYDNVVPGVIVTYAAPESGATGALSSTTATTEADGTASVTIDAGTTAGSYAVTASAPGVATPASFSLSNLAGEAHTISVSAGAPQSATVATPFAASLVALVQDSHGNPVAEVDVEFTAPASGPTATLEHATVTTGVDGTAATGLTAGTEAGDFTITATAPQTAAPAQFALTALAGAPATMTAAVSASPQSTEVGHSFAHPLAITVVDAYGNPVPSATITYHAPAE